MKQNPVRVSVIMGIHGQKNMEQLRRAVGSIVNQTLKELELIIYQDGYEDGVKEELEVLAGADARIILMGEEENHGLAYALNQCIRAAGGEYIARMDADDISKPERLECQAAFMEQHPEYAFCGCNAELIDENGVWGRRSMPEYPDKEDYLPYSPYIHPTVLFRKSVLDRCNGYRYDKSTLRCEDYDLFMRLYLLGEQGYNMQQCLFAYREDRSGYHKRRYRFRITEARLRFHGFRRMGLWGTKGLLYTIKPLLVGLIPAFVLERVKQRQYRRTMINENEPKAI